MRTFIAFALPRVIISAISSIQEDLKTHGLRVRWVPPENIHLTLKFLGEINPDDVSRIIAAIESAATKQRPFFLSIGAVGVFPGLSRARVIWAGVTGQVDALAEIHNSLETGLKTIGFPEEGRKFKGHLTIGRIKEKIAPQKLDRAITACRNFSSKPFAADKLILFKSDLQPSGAVYTRLASISL